MKTLTTRQILDANPGHSFTQRKFREDDKNYEYKLNIRYITLDKPLARFFFDNDSVVALYDKDGKIEWIDWYSIYKAYERNGEFVEMPDE